MRDWQNLFENAAESLSTRNYDLRGITQGKSEVQLTSLLQSDLTFLRPELNFYTEIPETAFKNIFEDAKLPLSVSDSRKKYDLVIYQKDRVITSYPECYIEFKFFVSTDTYNQKNPHPKSNRSEINLSRRDGEIINAKQAKQIEADFARLHYFKVASPNTLCLQGFYVCANPDGKYFKPGYDNSDMVVSRFLENYKTRKKIGEAKVIDLYNSDSDYSDQFWLKLILVEVIA
jgi:hypothetical protein